MKKTSIIIKLLIALLIVAALISAVALIGNNIRNQETEKGEAQTEQVQAGEAQTGKTQTGEVQTESKKDEKTEKTPKPEFVEEKDGVVYNASEKLNSEKSYDGLKITNVKLTAQDKGNSVLLLADVENISGKDTKEKEIKLIFFNKDKKEIASIKAILAPIKSGEKTKLNTKLSNPNLATQIVNAYDFSIQGK